MRASAYKDGNLTFEEVSKVFQINARLFYKNVLAFYAVTTQKGKGIVPALDLDNLLNEYKVNIE